MIIGLERAMEEGLTNIRFITQDASNLLEFFGEGELDRIYLNFSDPWPGKRHAKRRLTSERFLPVYKKILRPGGAIHFKTDNNELFEYSLGTFQEAGFALSEITRNLHERGPVGAMTDYEMKFHAQGVSINRCVATFIGERTKRRRMRAPNRQKRSMNDAENQVSSALWLAEMRGWLCALSGATPPFSPALWH